MYFEFYLDKWLQEDTVRRSQVETYLRHVDANIARGEIIGQPFYTEYLCQFEIIEYRTPLELDLDKCQLLLKLIAGSFSSKYQICFNGESNLPDLLVTVQSKKVSVTRSISELWSFQIERLFEIYLHEQMAMTGLFFEHNHEKKGIGFEREKSLNHYRSAIKDYMAKSEVFGLMTPTAKPPTQSKQLSLEKDLLKWLEEMKTN